MTMSDNPHDDESLKWILKHLSSGQQAELLLDLPHEERIKLLRDIERYVDFTNAPCFETSLY